ncbi:MAG: CPBP family intramembrane metalloprotease [Calditrichaeota bacterium]|nr:MAG: CPBP family intramembrane metalloprotease [Calditrichota bacterium]
MNHNFQPPSEEPTSPTPREAVWVILLSFFFFVFVTILLTAVLGIEMDEAAVQNSWKVKWMLFFGEISLALIPYLYLRRKNLPVASTIRWQHVPASVFWLSFPMGLSLALLSDEIDRLIQLVIPRSEEATQALIAFMKVNSFIEFLPLFLSAVIAAALIEEAIFRGFLQGVLEKYTHLNRAIIYASLAWTFLHLTPFSLSIAIPIFLFGYMLGYFTWRTRSIIPAIICHGMNNGLALLYYNIDFSEHVPFYEWKGQVSPFLIIPAVFVVYKGVQYLETLYRSESLSSSDASSSDS